MQYNKIESTNTTGGDDAKNKPMVFHRSAHSQMPVKKAERRFPMIIPDPNQTGKGTVG